MRATQPVGARTGEWPDRPGSRTSSEGPSQLAPGFKVRVDGLVGAAHLNGLAGVLQHFDDKTLRWHVELPNGETKAMKSENLAAFSLRKEASGHSLPAVHVGRR